MSVIACPFCHAPMTISPDQAAAGAVRCPRCRNPLSLAPPALSASDEPLPAEPDPAPRAPRRPNRARQEAEPAEPDEGKTAVRASGCATFGGCLVILLACGGAFSCWSAYKQRALDDLAAADRSYAEGKKAEAVAKYKDRFSHVPGDRRAEVIKRVADHEATAGDKAEARRWVEKGLDGKMNIAYESPAARDLLAQVQRERAEAEAKKQAEIARKQAEAAKRKAEEEERRKGIAIPFDDLRQEYASDRKAADAKYKGQTLRVSGTLHEYIAPDPDLGDPQPILSLQPNVMPWIWCHFPRGSDAQLRGLRPGQSVTIRGHCDGIFGGQIRLSGCSLEP